MIIMYKKQFTIGVLMALGFMVLLMVIISPVFDGKNGLEYADDTFNKLSKGSSYFVPKLAKSSDELVGTPVKVAPRFDDAETAERISKLMTVAGATAQADGTTVAVDGDLGKLLGSVIKDSDLIYHNQGKEVAERYGYDEKHVMKDWWLTLDKINRELQARDMMAQSKALSDVMKKGIEPAYNFYTIEPVNVADRAGTMAGILAFYVLYTIWWGFSILYIFEGLGITTTKAKVKKEV